MRLVSPRRAVWTHRYTASAISTISSGEGVDISDSGSNSNVFDTTASISAAAQVTSDGVHHAAVSASASLLVPIPVAGPEFRYYLTNSPRLFVQGQVYGMYFFGYGNYVSAWGNLGFTINRHLSVDAGYQLGSRLVVSRETSTHRIGLNLTEKGPSVGEFSF